MKSFLYICNYTLGCDFIFQCILHQYTYSLNSCSPETLLKVGAAYPDMAVQEKVFDHFLQLLRKDQVSDALKVVSHPIT